MKNIFIFPFLIIVNIIIGSLKIYSQDEIIIFSVFDEGQNIEKYGFKNMFGDTLVKPEYDIAFDYADSIGITLNYDGDLFLWDVNGKLIKKIMQATALCPIEEDFRAYPNMLDGIFSEGFLPIGKSTDEDNYWNYIWGYVDINGKNAVRPNYVLSVGFKEQLAPTLTYVKETDTEGNPLLKWGYLNKRANMIIPAQFESASHFSEGLAAVSVVTNDTDSYGIPINKWGYIDKSGNYVIAPKYLAAYRFSSGLANVLIMPDSGSIPKWGYINKKGDIIIEPIFDDCMPFSEGYAAVGFAKYEDELDGIDSDPPCLWGFIDKSGELVIPPIYEDVISFTEGIAPVAIIGETVDETEVPGLLWGYVNINNKLVSQFKWTNALPFKNGKAKVQFVDSESTSYINFIDKDGNELYEAVEGEIFCPFTFHKDKYYRGY